MLGLTLTPIESIEIIYQLMAENVAKKNHVMLKACQELLLLIASKVPILLTHPGTIDAMLINLTHSDDEWNLTNTLQILSAIKDGGKGMKANKKTARSGTQMGTHTCASCFHIWCADAHSSVLLSLLSSPSCV